MRKFAEGCIFMTVLFLLMWGYWIYQGNLAFIPAPTEEERADEAKLGNFITDLRNYTGGNLCNSYKNYHQARILREGVLEDPIRKLTVLDTNMKEIEQMEIVAVLRLVFDLTDILRKGNYPGECHYVENFTNGGFANYTLPVSNQYEVAKDIMKFIHKYPVDTKVDYDRIASPPEMMLAIFQYTKEDAKELRKRWLINNKGQWGDAAGMLRYYLTEDKVHPLVLGLTAEQAGHLLELAYDDK